MSIYHRYGKGPFSPSTRKIDLNNMDDYFAYALEMDTDVKWMNGMIGLTYRLEHFEELNDSLYSVEYLTGRLTKMEETKKGLTQKINHETILSLKFNLFKVNNAIKVQLPIVMDKITGKEPDNHRKMSELDDERMRLEDELVKLYQETYPLLYEVLPKIFYLLIDGVDIKTIESCFAKLKQVLSGQISTKSAENALMAESSEKYKLPTGFWDPMIKKG